MNVNDVRLLVQAMEERKDASSPLLPGTVADSLGEGILLVSMDGDPENTEIEVVSFIPGVSEGDRVMVLFDPPRGAYAIGLLGRAVEAGQIVGYTRRTYSSSAPFVQPDYTPQASLQAFFTLNRLYRFDYTMTFKSADSASFPWMYGNIINQFSSDRFFPAADTKFFVGTSVSDANMVYHTVTAFRIIECIESTSETFDVYLDFGQANDYEGEFELVITDVGPVPR